MKIPVEEQYKYVKLTLPNGSKAEGQAVLLHACCAPCSAAIVECMLRNGMKPTVYFSNSNIYPQQEYDVRKHELKRFLECASYEEQLAVIPKLDAYFVQERISPGGSADMLALTYFLYFIGILPCRWD